MKKAILASRFDLPFYLRLPSKGFFTWDPECGVAAVYPRQRIGEESFSKSCKFVNAERLLDSSCPPIDDPSQHKVLMTCNTKAYGEVPTLHIDTGPTGGYSELRAYSEVTIFIIIPRGHDPFS